MQASTSTLATPFLSIIIPAYNEEERLPRTLHSLTEYLRTQTYTWELIIVDDGSTDQTASLSQAASALYPVHVISYKENRGKGYALRKGILEARGTRVLTYDADSAVPPEEISLLMKTMDETGADIVVGSRLRHPDPTAVTIPPLRRSLGFLYASLCRNLVPQVRDCSCGCKLLEPPVARELFSKQKFNGFTHDVEILHIASNKGYLIKEIPVRWKAIPGSKVRVLRDGWVMVWQTLPLIPET